MKDKVEYSQDVKEKNGKWQHLVDYCMEFYDTIKDSEYRSAKIKEIKEARKIYEQKADKTDFPWPDASNVVLPLTTITVDNMEPRLVAGLIGKSPIVQFEMEGLTEKDEATEIIEDWFNSELKNVVKIEDIARDIIHTLLNDGTYYALGEYDNDEIVRRDFVFDDKGNIAIGEDLKPKIQDKTETVFDGGKIEAVEFTDMYVPDNAECWEKTDFARMIRPTYAELQRLKDKIGYMNIDEYLLKDKVPEITDDNQSPTQSTDNVSTTGKEVIEVLQFHISYVYQEEDQKEEDIEDFTEERLVVEIAKDCGVLIRLVLLRDLNYKNEHLIKRVRLFPERGKAYGTGIYGKMKSIQNGASDTFNRLMNVLDIVMIPWFFYDERSNLTGKPELYPGAGVKVDSVEGIKFPNFSVNPSQYLEFINSMWIPLWERLGSLGDLQVGRKSQSGDQTATEVLAVIQEGNIKHNYQSSVFKEEFLTLLRTIYDLYYQYMPFDKKFIYRGQEINIPRQFMRRPYKFRLTGSTEMANKIIERQQSEDFYKLASNDPLIDKMKKSEQLIKTYWPNEDVQEWIDKGFNQMYQIMSENPEIMQVVQKYMQDKMAIQEKLGAGTPTE